MTAPSSLFPLFLLVLLLHATSTHAFVRRVPPPPPSVDAILAFLTEDVYPEHPSDHRKTLAFKAQDDFLLGQQQQRPDTSSSLLLTKALTTYGEFPLASLYAILERLQLGPDDVFLDLGSGCGRLVLGVALLFPHLKASLGLEVVPELHALALDAQSKADTKAKERGMPMAPCRFIQGNVETGEYVDGENPLGETTALFSYCTTYRSDDGLHLAQPLREALLTHAQPDNITIMTTDKRFREGEVDGVGRGFRVVDRMTVPNPEVFESEVYFHKIERRK